jgi:formamidopyrimidine-DNA glycosylase
MKETNGVSAFGLDRGGELRYLDDNQMGKTYLVPVSDKSVVPGFDTVGIDPLSPDFTVDRLREMVCSRRDQARAFLLDKTATVSLGPVVTRGALSAA